MMLSNFNGGHMSEKTTKLWNAKESKRVVSAFTTAAGFVRGIALKRFVPKARRREFEEYVRDPDSYRARCQIYREKGFGNVPTIVLGGFVPDATETVEFQRKLLRQHGSIYYVNYSRNGFNKKMFTAQLKDLIENLAKKGPKATRYGHKLWMWVTGKFSAQC